MKQKIIDIIDSYPGIKGTDIIVRFVSDTQGIPDYGDVVKTLEQLVNDKSIVEVEYITPQMDYRIKSMYFPKGTQITVK